METKICIKCKIEKSIYEFYKDKTKKCGYRNNCKKCQNEKTKLYKQLNKDKMKIYRDNGKENLKQWRQANTEYIKKQKKEWYLNNKNKNNESSKKWRKNNPIKANESSKKSNQLRRLVDPLFNFQNKIRNNINKSLKNNGYTKKSKTTDILGCSFENFKLYIESKFEDWMNWDNKGLYNGELNYGWDVDHIIPLSSATTEEELLKLNHFSNLQPLCSYTNRCIKRDKY